MASYNRIIMAGNLTKDPEFKELGSGQFVCRLSMASNRQYKNRQTGAITKEVCFIDVDVWGPQAESCKNSLRMGSPVLIEGRLKFDTWKDNEGRTRSRHSIVAERVVFLGGRQDESGYTQSEEGLLSDSMTSSQNMTASAASVTPAAPTSSAPKASRAKKQSNSASVDIDAIFKDQAALEDDLPF